MAPQVHQADYYDHLAKVGREGFALLDEINRIRRPKKFEDRHQQPPQHYNNHQFEHLQPLGYSFNGPQIIIVRKCCDANTKEPVIDSNQAAQLYGGVVVEDHSIRKLIPNHGY